MQFDIRYLAGYVDADGSICIGLKKGASIEVQISVYGHNTVLLDWLQQEYPAHRRDGARGVPCWRATGDTAEHFLRDVYWHLHYKQRQAELAIKLLHTRTNSRHRLTHGQKCIRYEWALEICKLNQANLGTPKETKTMRRLVAAMNPPQIIEEM